MNVDWGVVLGIATIAFVFVALFVEYRSGRFVPRKKLVYEILSQSQIIKKGRSGIIARDIKVRWKGKEVENLIVVPLVLECTGRKEIVPADFHQPINVKFNGVLLDAFVTRTKPANLIKNVELDKEDRVERISNEMVLEALEAYKAGKEIRDPNKIILPPFNYLKVNPLLLNHKNLIEITLLFAEFDSLEIESHIAGVKIEERRSVDISLPAAVFLGMAFVFAGVVGMYLGIALGEVRASKNFFALVIIVFWGGVLLSKLLPMIRSRVGKSRP